MLSTYYVAGTGARDPLTEGAPILDPRSGQGGDTSTEDITAPYVQRSAWGAWLPLSLPRGWGSGRASWRW